MNAQANTELKVIEIDHENHGKVVVIQCVECGLHNIITDYLDRYKVKMIRKVVTGNVIAMHCQGYPLVQIENILEKMIRDLSKPSKQTRKVA